MFAGKIYDLSQPLYHNCPQWPEYKPVDLNHTHTLALNGFNAERVSLTTHSGTHIDAPYHFFAGRATIEQMPLETFIGPVTLLDLRGKEPESFISNRDLRPHVSKIKPGDIVILNTGWGKRRAMSREFLTQWPYLDEEGAQLLVQRQVKGVGIDALSIGGWGSPDKGQPSHQVLLGANVFVIEDLHIPDEVMDGKRRTFCAFPILLQSCGGAWTRAVIWDGTDESA